MHTFTSLLLGLLYSQSTLYGIVVSLAVLVAIGAVARYIIDPHIILWRIYRGEKRETVYTVGIILVCITMDVYATLGAIYLLNIAPL